MNDPIHHITMYLNPLANEGLWTVDAHDRTDQINERGASILGHTAEEMMGRPTTDFLFPEDVDDELNWLKELRKGRGGICERRLRHRNGSEVWISSSTVPIFDDAGQYAGAMRIFLDITDERGPGVGTKRERADLFSTMFSSNPSAMSIVRASDSRLVDVNESWLRLFEFGREEVIGRSVRDLNIYDEDRSEIGHTIVRRPGEGGAREQEVLAHTRRGRPLTLMVVNVRVTVDGADHILSTAVDITENKAREENFRHLIKYAPTAIFEIDFRGPRLTSINEAMSDLTGYSQEELLSMDPADLLVGSDRERFRMDIERGLSGKRTEASVEYRIRTKDGVTITAAFSLKSSYENGKQVGALVVGHDVTKLRRTEEVLSHLNERFEMAQKAARVGVWDWDITTGKIEWSKEMYNLLGLHPAEDEANFDTWNSVLHLDDVEIANERIQRSLRDHTFLDNEYRVVRRDGQVIWVNALGQGEYNDQGQPVRMIGICVDITGRKTVEEALKESQRTFRSLFSSSNEGIALHELVLDHDGAARDYRIVDVNPAFERATDMPRERAIGALASELYGTGEAPFLETYAQVERTGEPIFFETYFEPMRRHFQISAFKPKEGQFATTFVDISKLKKAQRQIEVQRARLRTVIDNAPGALVVADDKGRVRMTNRKADALYRQHKLRGEGFESHAKLQLCYPDGRPYPSQDLPLTRSALYGETYVDLDMDLVWPDGEVRHLLVNSAPITGNDGSRIGAVEAIMDITDRRRTELELKRSNAELQQFAFVSSHDMKEPLRMITAYLSLLEKQFGDKLEPKAKEYMMYVNSGAERMRQMVNDLLQFSNIDAKANGFHPVDMNEVLSIVRENIHFSMLELNAKVHSEPLPMVTADRTQMIQLMTNLLSNAIKFHGADPPRVWISSTGDYSEWTFTIRDNGIGIDPKYQSNLFKMFTRLHSQDEYPGTGIGLAISKKIVERHGGQIWCESDGAIGSTFYFTLPRNI
jgi:PAS domain S-box-containing protein